MIRGPKAILSSAIANALGEYFLVDASTIESNLLSDAKIVLKSVQLKEKIVHLPLNSAGNATSITVTGCVDEVAFSWAWNSSKGEANWVTNAVLTVSGAKFHAKLEHAERDEVVTVPPEETDLGGSFVNPATIDEESAEKIKQEQGGLAGFVERQVKMVMDTLTLRMVGFELRITLPRRPTSLEPADGAGEDLGVSATAACNKTFIVEVERIEVVSLGRLSGGASSRPIAVGNEGKEIAPTKLKQTIILSSFACGIYLEGEETDQIFMSHPFIEPFSYSADVIRFGERFGGFMKGLEVFGLGQITDSPDMASFEGSELTVHLGTMQVNALMQLSVMVLAPPDDEANDAELGNLSEHSTTSSDDEWHFGADDPSSFCFPLASASLILFGDMHFKGSGIQMRYTADGTTCMAEAEKMEYESHGSGRARASQVVMTMRPVMKMSLGCIEDFFIQDTLLLSSPIQSSELIYEGQTITIGLGTLVEVTTYSKEDVVAGPTIVAPKLPCNINLYIHEGMKIKKSEDGSVIKIGRLNIYGLSQPTETKFAVQCESLQNPIVSMNTVSTAGTLKDLEPDQINDFIFTAGDISVRSGYTTDEWQDAFQPRKHSKAYEQPDTKHSKAEMSKPKAATASSPIKLPFASIADLRVTIGVKGSHNIAGIKETTMVIKSFQGKATTTSKDLVNYYTARVLSRVPGFIKNVEVLGLNVFDNAAGMLSNFAGVATLGSALGAGAGVAAVTAVDAIKGAVDAGKRSRNVDEGAAMAPLDLVRGIVQAANEATQYGAEKRGKKEGDGNLIDWTIGATGQTADYVVKNKNRLGAAGAGGGGFLLGMALGGPIGGIIGGLVANATTGATLEMIDEKVQQKAAERVPAIKYSANNDQTNFKTKGDSTGKDRR